MPLSLDVSHRGGRVLVVATAGPADVAAPAGAGQAPGVLQDATRVRLARVDASHLPVVLAAWCGLEPRWTCVATAAPSEADLLRPVDDSGAPCPADADDGLRRAWDGDWYLWTVHLPGQAVGRVVVRAGDGGSWLLTGASGLGEPGRASGSPPPSPRTSSGSPWRWWPPEAPGIWPGVHRAVTLRARRGVEQLGSSLGS